MNVIIDTNVMVAALLGKEDAAARQTIGLALQDKLTPLMGDALFNEYLDVISREDLMQKCPFNSDERMDFLAAFFSSCQWCRIYFGWRPNLQDEGDNHLIELAIAGGAKYIITTNVRDFKNGELLFDNLRVVTPQEFIKEALWA
ncbi:putative toxin-antitoxin system toxin component, PIN family [Candidatus Thiothrix sp. Deng01]|uniref:Toxin-antitoxin system toxin component, PIN family n=1 Tax=Candidatus Thiothrix phosphatis TaxID=3112415 RepID=A0ABU6CXM0_9GAMM|nr:putative toxin-antitoxin system toxin component, PIN family [Candidatus Thiothrix sp. Deng01]MEB4591500.1 putative toxin-antitoxin system toxin component, PIN family [Candidatus Thiothrix sp. Deng01]